jgi:hypothetical protein
MAAGPVQLAQGPTPCALVDVAAARDGVLDMSPGECPGRVSWALLYPSARAILNGVYT